MAGGRNGGVDQAFTDAIAQVSIFAGMSAKACNKICRTAKVLDYATGEELTVQATKGSRFHLILEGEVEVRVNNRRKAILGPGATLGEIALIDGQPRTATVKALTPVRTLSLASWNFRSLLRDEPVIAENVMRNLVQRIRELERSPMP